MKSYEREESILSRMWCGAMIIPTDERFHLRITRFRETLAFLRSQHLTRENRHVGISARDQEQNPDGEQSEEAPYQNSQPEVIESCPRYLQSVEKDASAPRS